jgi:hypothetical protein
MSNDSAKFKKKKTSQSCFCTNMSVRLTCLQSVTVSDALPFYFKFFDLITSTIKIIIIEIIILKNRVGSYGESFNFGIQFSYWFWNFWLSNFNFHLISCLWFFFILLVLNIVSLPDFDKFTFMDFQYMKNLCMLKLVSCFFFCFSYIFFYPLFFFLARIVLLLLSSVDLWPPFNSKKKKTCKPLVLKT